MRWTALRQMKLPISAGRNRLQLQLSSGRVDNRERALGAIIRFAFVGAAHIGNAIAFCIFNRQIELLLALENLLSARLIERGGRKDHTFGHPQFRRASTCRRVCGSGFDHAQKDVWAARWLTRFWGINCHKRS